MQLSGSQTYSTSELEYQTKIIASLVPDEIIYGLGKKDNIPQYNACLMMGDVSGFTDLSVKFNMAGKGGPSRLTEILNSFIGSMVQEILMRAGDVLKFSGDAFLAMWKEKDEQRIHNCVTQALECALVIQKDFGRYETEVGVVLKVKLAIAAGDVTFCVIGDQMIKHYAVLGMPVFDVKRAEYLCSSGDILVSQTAWMYINAPEYEYEQLPDGYHVKVLGVGSTWRNVQRINFDHEDISFQSDQDDDDDPFPLAFSDRVPEPEATPILMSLTGEKVPKKSSAVADTFVLRPSINHAIQNNMKEILRPFIISPVMRGVENMEPLEYLTEMRQVVIVFINLITLPGIKTLTSVIDNCYQTVCKIVSEARGCVNKVSLFDKDLMMLVIFGLRGFILDLASQIALRCAADIRPAVTSIYGVIESSIGVTTGMTYCGIVGHIMRQEYTVMGVPVNKAARLMVAYPGKVTCDRETFLHSKMEARHFILQEPKELKGLTAIGPIYEFKEQVAEKVRETVCKFPLLSRVMELKLFDSQLRSMKERRQRHVDRDHKGEKDHRQFSISLLLIQAPPRQGKTRLLNEMVYHALCDGVAVHRFGLTMRDQKLSFIGIRYIFSAAIESSDPSSAKEREKKIVHHLKNMEDPEMLCCLNKVFNVDFEVTARYRQLSIKERHMHTSVTLQHLLNSCFQGTCVIALDDCEFLDEDSWEYLPALLETDCVFFVMTLSNRFEASMLSEKATAHRNVHKLTLGAIEKWFLAGVACQILEVAAIPSELDRVIQMRSNGNPGWIESYLVSLIQTGGLVVRRLPTSIVDEMGLIKVPLSMLERSNAENTFTKFDTMSSLKTYGMQSQADDQQVDHENVHDKPIAVCTLAPHARLDDFGADVTMDVMMIKLFDSLAYEEQLVLKYSSVIGETFTRHMLLALMDKTSPREVALAIKRLFEIRVLSCAGGNFSDNANLMLIAMRAVQVKSDQGLVCHCVGLTIDEACSDLPAYARCGFLKFRVPAFRETTYNLLTDHQKKEFHSKSVRYLEQETRRCGSCGAGYFTNILCSLHLHYDYEEEVGDDITTEALFMTKDPVTSGLGYIEDATLFEQINYEEVLLAKLHHQDPGDPVLTYRRNSGQEQITSAAAGRRRRLLGMCFCSPVHYIPSFGSLSPSFSSFNFAECQCPLILTAMYIQLLEHCRGAGRRNQIVSALLEYSELCISLSNLPLAIQLLEDARHTIKGAKNTDASDEESAIPEWKVPFVLGKILTMMGYCGIELGQLEDASRHLHQAMLTFGYPFPQERLISCHTFMQKLRQKFLLRFPRTTSGYSGFSAFMADQMSACLGQLFHLFTQTGRWRSARLSAIWSLNKSLETNNFNGLCNAYANMTRVALYSGNKQLLWRLEHSALSMCYDQVSILEIRDLQAVARLYLAVFMCRMCRGELERAVGLGFKTLRISTSVNDVRTRLELLPPMTEALRLTTSLPQSVTVLNDLHFMASDDVDKSGTLWYYASCIDMLLDTGYSMVAFAKCEQLYRELCDGAVSVRDPSARSRFVLTLWLWAIRNEDWEAAASLDSDGRHHFTLQPNDTLTNATTGLRLLEGLLLLLVAKVGGHDLKALADAYVEIDTLIVTLSKVTKVCELAMPYFLILKAYYRQVRRRDAKVFKLLARARDVAHKHGNALHVEWALHSEKVWRRTVSPLVANLWKERSGKASSDWHEAELSAYKAAPFSLPLPAESLAY